MTASFNASVIDATAAATGSMTLTLDRSTPGLYRHQLHHSFNRPRSMTMKKSLVPILGLTLILAPFARAELPPGSYDALRLNAEEAVIIEVEAVKTKDGKVGQTEVIVEARVVAVERSKTHLKKGGKITIRYESIDKSKTPGSVGPRQIPILKKGDFYPAFLNEKEKVFGPAAYGESFVMTPEI